MLTQYITSTLRTASPTALKLSKVIAGRWLVATLLCACATAMAQQSLPQDADTLLEAAWRFESSGDYAGASEAYRNYLLTRPPKSATRRNVRLKLPVLQEASQYGPSIELDLFLSALNSRAAGDTGSALALMNRITTNYPVSHYYDDALYLKAYIELMDNYDFSRAHNTLQSLRFSNPNSRCLLYTSPSPRDGLLSRMPSSA